MTNQQKKEFIQHMLTSLEAPIRSLSKWEEDFIASITDQFNTRGTLSDRQVEILEKVYAEKT